MSALAPLQFKGGRAPQSSSGRQPAAEPGLDGSGSTRLLCSVCGNLIARASALFCMHGHDGPSVFVNPHGLVFELVTLRVAQGLVAAGGATTEHTWFVGYAWQVVCCAQCFTHLGWRFTATGGSTPSSFYGLIRRALVEDEEPEP